MNKWELLAALQALAIYIIERLNTDGTGYETLDALLIRTVTVELHPDLLILCAKSS
jgi:hypothetical protein